MTGKGRPEEVARFFRQREELGAGDLFMDGLKRAEALSLVADRLRDAVPAGRSAAKASSSDEAETIPSPTPGTLDLSALDYDALRQAAMGCQRCRLARERSNVVFSDGNPTARLMVVGEAPGANEDRTGLPFVGQAGKLLDLMLASIDLSRRESVYICNVLKCRPPGNRDPMQDEIELCSPYLKRQIELVAPEVILAVGTFAAKLLTGAAKPLGRLRGEIYSYEGVPLIVTYHPAALLRNRGWTRPAWDDLQLLRQVLDNV